MAEWLQERGVQVFVEGPVYEAEFPHLTPFVPGETRVDFAVTLGGVSHGCL